MKAFVTGANGQLGHDLLNALQSRGHSVVGCDLTPVYCGAQDGSFAERVPYFPLDITDEPAVREAVFAQKPDAVFHCAAWTAVDKAEEAENRDRVYAVNALGTRHIALACRAAGAKMVYISTDYVFDGTGERPWRPEDKSCAPCNVYGQTKLEGEKAVRALLTRYFIVRTAWAFGLSGSNFVKTMLRIGKTHDTVRVVCDQIGTPTYTRDLARLLVDMAETEAYGYYHATNEGGYISWYDFAKEIFQQAGLSTEVIPVTTAQYGLSAAARPHNSRLDKSKLIENGFAPLPDWRDALHRYLQEIGEGENGTDRG